MSILKNREKTITLKLPVLGAAFVLLSALGLMGGSASAGPIPASWSCTGNCGTAGADGVVTLSPGGGSSYFWISTEFGAADAGQISGVGGTNGTLMTTALFDANAGDPLNFYFNYVTSDGAQYADYAWARLYDSSDILVATLFTARTEPSGTIAPGLGLPANDSTLTPAAVPIIPGGPIWSPLGASSGNCYDAGCGYTGWIQSTYNIPVNDTYYIAFGATNFIDNLYDSGLAIDNVTINDIPIPGEDDVPEPATLALFGLGLLGLGALRRRI